MKLLRVTNSNIKGYHHYKIRPAKEIEMVVEKVLKTCHDPYAICQIYLVNSMIKSPEKPKEILLNNE